MGRVSIEASRRLALASGQSWSAWADGIDQHGAQHVCDWRCFSAAASSLAAADCSVFLCQFAVDSSTSFRYCFDYTSGK
jgi:hypothetical protein